MGVKRGVSWSGRCILISLGFWVSFAAAREEREEKRREAKAWKGLREGNLLKWRRSSRSRWCWMGRGWRWRWMRVGWWYGKGKGGSSKGNWWWRMTWWASRAPHPPSCSTHSGARRAARCVGAKVWPFASARTCSWSSAMMPPTGYGAMPSSEHSTNLVLFLVLWNFYLTSRLGLFDISCQAKGMSRQNQLLNLLCGIPHIQTYHSIEDKKASLLGCHYSRVCDEIGDPGFLKLLRLCTWTLLILKSAWPSLKISSEICKSYLILFDISFHSKACTAKLATESAWPSSRSNILWNRGQEGSFLGCQYSRFFVMKFGSRFSEIIMPVLMNASNPVVV